MWLWSILFPTVQKLYKSTNKCESYSRKQSDTFFPDTCLEKNKELDFLIITQANVDWFSIIFTAIFLKKFGIYPIYRFPLHHRYVTAIFYETWKWKNLYLFQQCSPCHFQCSACYYLVGGCLGRGGHPLSRHGSTSAPMSSLEHCDNTFI